MDRSDPNFHVRRRYRWLCAVSVAAVLAWPALATASTVVTWSQVQGGPTHLGYATNAPGPPFKEAWHLAVPLAGGTCGASSPVVAGSTSITVTHDSIVAADVSTGSQRWTVQRDDGPPVPPAVAVHGTQQLLVYTEGFGDTSPDPCLPAATSSPASASGSPTPAPPTDGTFDSHVAAIDLTTHESAWNAPLQLKEVSRTGVTVAGDTAYVGDNRGNVYAVDVATGELRWTRSLGGFLTAPLGATRDLVLATVQASRSVRPRIVALKTSDGSQVWATEVQASAAFVTGPAIAGDQVFAGFSDQTIRCFTLADGVERWSARMNGAVFFTGGLAVAPDAVIAVDSLGDVYRFDPGTGERVWDFALNDPVLRSSPVVAGSHVLVATGDGRLVAIDLETGTLVWQSAPADAVLRGLTPTADVLVSVQGGNRSGLTGYVTDPDGSLVAIESPTVVNLGLLVGAFLAAAIPLAAVLIFGGRALRARMGPAFLDDEEEIADPWEDDDGGGADV